MRLDATRTEQSPAGTGRELARRAGFWGGLALFAAAIFSPPPGSVREAARAQFADALPADTAAILHAQGRTDVNPDAPAYLDAERRVIDARARTMMSAAAVTLLVACWWISTAVPIPVTSLLPLLLFPIVGVLPLREAAVPYADPNVFLFMGGFIIALGIQRWELHRRIALQIVAVIGTGRRTIVLGFMLASATLSMWISNTATTMMMLPVGLAVIASLSEMEAPGGYAPRDRTNFAVALMLGIAYGANAGGVATPVGTPPNIVFRGQMEQLFPGAPELGFGQWMLLFLPFVVVFVPVIWLVLVRVTCRFAPARGDAGRELVRRQLRALGPLSRPARAMLIVFAATTVLWMTRSIPVSREANYGWAHLVETWLTPADGGPPRFRADDIGDATIALGMSVLLFIIPAGHDKTGSRQFLMNWETARQLPWGILLLFGGGFALAAGFQSSGLSLWCGQMFASSGIDSPLLLIAGTCLLMTFLTEITSNTATTQVMLPILARVSGASGLNPMLLMLPATISASCAFMLPVATPPNAIVFGSGHVPMGRMVRTGLILNLIGVVLVTLVIYFLAPLILGADLTHPPEWAP